MSHLDLLPRPDAAVYPSAAGWGDPARRRQTLIDPRDGMAWAAFPMASPDDVAAAVAHARKSVPLDWTEGERAARIAMLGRLIEVMGEHTEGFVADIQREVGSPDVFARDKHVGTALDHLRAILAAAEATTDDQAPDPTAPGHRIRYEPLGVAALITPWNWPLNQLALKIGAALVSGCTMVLKPSELATPTALRLAQCMVEAGVPDGVFQLVLGDGETGAALTRAEVDVISFTGSTAVGREIAQTAAARFVRTNLELGGKSPNLLFGDCELPLAVEQGVAHAFRNAGQSCNAASRMLVEASIYDEVLALAEAQATETYPLPLVNADQFRRVQGHIEAALVEGARLIAGGPGAAPGSAGFTPRPTVFADVTSDMRLAREEVFGPVLAITKFETEAEAIALANTTDYGLAAYVQTGDPARADRVSRQLRAGMVQVNGSSRAAGAPFGGRKASGWGREAGLWGIRAFQDIKSVSGAAAG